MEMLFMVLSILKMSVIFLLKPLGLGFYIFFCSLIVSLIMNWVSLSWYALIFFLLYVGGLLVLFFYIISFSFKPNLKMKNFFYLNFCFFFSIINFGFFMFLNYKFLKLNLNLGTDLSKNLFSVYEKTFLVFIVVFLFLVLWLITKFLFRKRMSMRFFK